MRCWRFFDTQCDGSSYSRHRSLTFLSFLFPAYSLWCFLQFCVRAGQYSPSTRTIPSEQPSVRPGKGSAVALPAGAALGAPLAMTPACGDELVGAALFAAGGVVDARAEGDEDGESDGAEGELDGDELEELFVASLHASKASVSEPITVATRMRCRRASANGDMAPPLANLRQSSVFSEEHCQVIGRHFDDA
ncbi:MAG: hypothetical protein U0165_01145 [Polyangiaceae bacterium]